MELNEIREKIDDIDNSLLELFLRRMELSEQVSEYKKEHGLPVLSASREREILDRVAASSGAMELYSNRLFTTIMQLSRTRQAELTAGNLKVAGQIKESLSSGGEVFPKSALVACQGVEGSNSQAACDKLLSRGRIVYVRSFEAVFDAVESGLCQFGVLPIENSSNGSVREVYQLLQSKGFYIVRSTRMNIRHELMAKPGVKLSDIREIYSHQQAIGQCSKFLSGLPDVKVIPMANTATAALQVEESESRTSAAICSHSCAVIYGLEPIDCHIQDSENNYTRFICITKKPAIFAGANRVSLIADCSNTPGALHTLLARVAAQDVNMIKLESCPVTGRNFEYVFFIDLEMSVYDEGELAMLEDLERSCESFIFLGAYQEV